MNVVNMYDLVSFYLKKWRFVLVMTLLGLAVGAGYTFFMQTPRYKSSATLILISENGTFTTKDSNVVNNYISLLKSRRVIDPVIADKKLATSYDDLSRSIEASSSKDTEVIKLSVSTANARESQVVTQEIIGSFKQQVKNLYKSDVVKVVDTASYDGTPYNVNVPLQLSIAPIAGFIAALTILFFAYDFLLSKNSHLREVEAEQDATRQPRSAHVSVVHQPTGISIPQRPTSKRDLYMPSRNDEGSASQTTIRYDVPAARV